MKAPCSVCGIPKPTSTGSLKTITCQPCRRAQAATPDGIERKRALNRGYARTYRATHDLSPRKRTKVQPDTYRARARHHSVAYQHINRTSVCERDGWQCGICQQPVDRQLKWPNQMCASLDHIVPMSLGGGHLYANVQCAHWLCNTLKSDRVDTGAASSKLAGQASKLAAATMVAVDPAPRPKC